MRAMAKLWSRLYAAGQRTVIVVRALWLPVTVLCAALVVPFCLANPNPNPDPQRGSSSAPAELAELHYSIQEELPVHNTIANIIKDAELDLKYGSSDLQKLRFSLHERRGTRPGFKDFFVIDREGLMQTAQVIDRDAICAHQATCPIPLNIMVQPGQFFQIIKLTVHIVDINDNSPVFPQQTIELAISESTLPGAVFALPTAEDQDSGIYTIQRYHLVSTSDKFDLKVTNSSIGSVDLQLVLTETVDREAEEMFQMEVVAVDGGTPPKSGVIQIHVKVIDANDNNPTFDNYTYDVTVPENSPVGMILLKVHATDPDTGINGEVFYKLSDRSKEEHGDRFGIEAQTGDLYLRSNLDYEVKQAYYLTITAQDQGPNSLPAYAKVIIHVGDINDHTPEITVNSLTPSGLVQVEEGSPEGTFVAHISVVDLDAGRSGEVRCSMDSYEFRLEQLYQTEYKIVSTAIFDREVKAVYHLRIVCEDLGVPIQASSKHVVVTVIDANDNAPVFEKPVYIAQVRENIAKGAFIVHVSAADSDVGGNGALTFDILGHDASAVVKINSQSGVIRSNVVFDYEKESYYQFTVIAKDNGDPVLTGSTTLRLNVIDSNDEVPKFDQPRYDFRIPENAPSNTYIGTVFARDLDSPKFNQVRYSLDPYGGGLNSFSVDPISGDISTLRILDREKVDVYHLVMVASNEGFPHMKSTVNTTVHVLDVNDNAPVFDFPSDTNSTIQIATDVPIGTPIIQVKARDPDEGNNGSLLYYITHGNERGYFAINSTSGQMRLTKNLAGLRNQEFVIAITVRDKGSDPLQSMMDLNIIANHSLAILQLRRGHGFSLEAFIRNPLLMGTLAAIILVLLLVCLTICLLRCRRHKVHQHHKHSCAQQEAAMTAASRRPRNVKWKNNIEWKVIPNDYCSSEEMRQDGSPGRGPPGPGPGRRGDRASPSSPQKAQEDLWPPPPQHTDIQKDSTLPPGYTTMLPMKNGTIPVDRSATTTRVQQHNPQSGSPYHHHTLPPNHKAYGHPSHQPQAPQLRHSQSPKHPMPTTSSGVPASVASRGAPHPHPHHPHQAPALRSFSSPQHQPAATVMPRSIHRDHYQPLTQHDLEMHEMLHLLPHDKDSESGSYTDSGRGPSEEGDNSLDRPNQPLPVKETNIDSVRRPPDSGAAAHPAPGPAGPHDRDYWMSPLTRIRDLKSFAPRHRSGLVQSDSDACSSFDDPETKQQQQVTPTQQQTFPPHSAPDPNCNSSSAADKLTAPPNSGPINSPCSTFLAPSSAQPRETNLASTRDNHGNPALDYGGKQSNQQNGNWEKSGGSGTAAEAGDHQMGDNKSPWRRSWDVESTAQSEGGTTTSGSYMVGDQDEISSVYSGNAFIV